MLLDCLEHVGKAAEYMRADRLALERAGPDSGKRALVRGNAEMIGPERDQPFGDAAIAEHRALQPRESFRAKGLLDHVERSRRLRRLRLGCVRLHRLRR